MMVMMVQQGNSDKNDIHHDGGDVDDRIITEIRVCGFWAAVKARRMKFFAIVSFSTAAFYLSISCRENNQINKYINK